MICKIIVVLLSNPKIRQRNAEWIWMDSNSLEVEVRMNAVANDFIHLVSFFESKESEIYSKHFNDEHREKKRHLTWGVQTEGWVVALDVLLLLERQIFLATSRLPWCTTLLEDLLFCIAIPPVETFEDDVRAGEPGAECGLSLCALEPWRSWERKDWWWCFGVEGSSEPSPASILLLELAFLLIGDAVSASEEFSTLSWMSM